MRGVIVAFVVASVATAVVPGAALAEWQPPQLHAATATLAQVLAANAKATGVPDPAFARRRERWTYTNGAQRIPVAVAVHDADYRATVTLDGDDYAAGRLHGVRWRANADGIAHATVADLQGDAVDRLPSSVFAFAAADCTLAGERGGEHPAWIIADRPRDDFAHWFFVDEASGLIVREETREGKRVVVTTFDDFAPVSGVTRPRHWHVSDGDAADDVDVRVDAIEPGAVQAADIALPEARRFFTAPDARKTIALRPTFAFNLLVDVAVNGRKLHFILDSGTQSIMLNRSIAEHLGLHPRLEHARVDTIDVGGITLANASVLAIPLGDLDGILGYDFFFGHVVRIDYPRMRVEVLDRDAGAAAFADGRTAVVPIDTSWGLPLVAGGIGPVTGDAFAIDTGSDKLIVAERFVRQHQAQLDARWTPTPLRGDPVRRYLEGSIVVTGRRVADFEMPPFRFTDFTVLAGERNGAADAIDLPFDGIIGTDQLSRFDVYFDYDNARMGLRR